jgi:chemotaxis protein histidine kinase CheA/ActR/RegA family two-component response regulator
VAQRIEALAEALAAGDLADLSELLQTQAEVFNGLAESLDLPGFGEIAQTTLLALTQSPDKVLEIAAAALDNYKAAQAAVLAGDRERGGEPSAALKQLCGSSWANQHAAQPTQSKAAHQAANRYSQPAKTSWLQQLWRMFTRPIGGLAENSGHASASKTTSKATSPITALELGTVADSAFEPPEPLIDYAIDDDEPADLALIDLIPADLASVNLPVAHAETNEPHAVTPWSNLGRSPSDEDNELAQLAPLALSSLSLSANPANLDTAPPTIELPNAPAKDQNATIRMTVEHLDQLSQAMGELLTQQNRQALYNEQLAILVKKLLNRIARQQAQLNQRRGQSKLEPIGSPDESRPPAASQLAYAHFDSLELDQYSDVQLLAQSFLEETVQQSESAEAIELFVIRSGQELEKQKRLLASTRETLLEARMLPLEKVFQRFPPALDRLKAQHHKPVNLTLLGEDVLVDKVIADKLYDPLLHLVRNAFDHGIESSEKRQQQNKPTVGNITIEAIQQGRHLVIHVKDDGQGLDLEMIRRKAVENQVVTAAEAAQLTSAQTVDLLFEAGFSTASEVDELSGRGVGLDAVRAQVRSLQGWVTVSYEPTQGTCFTLQIPSSLTIAKLLLCQAQGRIYALIADAIEHILIPSIEQVSAWEGGKTLTWQADGEEYLVPVNALADVLHYASPMPSHRLIETRSDIKASASNPVILLHHQNALVGIEVDHLLGEQELVISALGETIVPPAYLYGSSILPDGQLTLVLDGVMLAKIVLEQRAQGRIDISLEDAPQAKPRQPGPIFVKKLILTVDDSITVRNALAEALQKADYQVIQARDGAEALQQLQRYPDVQAILCDIEMPGMNGFEFLKARQQTPEIAAIPTIMLTSRAGAKHRLLTKELGATTYLTKPYLTPQLLKTVAEAISHSTHQPLSAAGSHE